MRRVVTGAHVITSQYPGLMSLSKSSSETSQSIVSLSNYVDKLSSLFMDIGRSAPRNQAMALLYPRSKKLQTYLSEYFIVVVGLCRHLFKFGQKSTVQQFASTLSDSNLKAFRTELNVWENSIREETHLSEAQENSGFRALSKKMFKSASYQQKLATNLQVLNFCSTYNHQTTWKQTRKAGNASFFVQRAEYQEWKAWSDPCTLMYTGKLGSGKSVLMANIVDDLNLSTKKTRFAVTYFFCRHDVPESLKARTILGSLARQLLCTGLDLTVLSESCEDTCSTGDIEEVLKLLVQGFPSSQRAYFVLDGLDECDHEEKEILVQAFQKAKKRLKITFCISFRIEPNNGLQSITERLAPTRVVSMPDDNPDIEAFIEADLERSLHYKRLIIGDPTLILSIQDALLEGSQGMFLWVALQIQSLCTMKTDQAIREALADLPKDLSETFSRILRKSGSSDQSLQTKTLQLVLAAYRPLTTDELREALSVTPGDATWDPSKVLNDIQSALACCGCLLVVDEEESTVRIVHHSAKQYILSGLNGVNDVIFSAEEARKTFADVVVTYLRYNVFGTELSRTRVHPVMAQSAPSRVMHATMGSSSTTLNMAMKLLKSRKQPTFDISKTLAEARKAFQPGSGEKFHFYPYAKFYWVKHIESLQKQTSIIDNLLPSILRGKTTGISVSDDDCRTLLWWATQTGHEETVKLLLEQGKANMYLKVKDGLALLCLWAKDNGRDAIVKLLLNQGANINQVGKYGNALQAASAEGQEAVVKLLLGKGADVNAQGGDYGNALQAASAEGQEAVVKLLLDKGADMNQVGKYGNALQMASVRGQEAVVRLLLDKGAEVNARGGHYGNALQAASAEGQEAVVKLLLDKGADYGSALQTASAGGQEAVVRLLLDKGADVNAQGGHCGSALQAASAEGQEAVVKLLLDKGADVNVQGGHYGNALQTASARGQEAVVRLLLDKGAEVNAQGGDYGSALQTASAGGQEAVVRLLLDKGADVNAQGGHYGNALQAASAEGQEAVVKLLLDKGAYINAQGGDYGSALQAASVRGQEAVVELLLDKGADVNAQDGHYGNALQAASAEGKETVVKLLLDKGAYINAQGGHYSSALQAASAEGQEAMVELLLDKGADVNAQGGDYGNALQAASAGGQEAVVKLLLDKGADYGSALQTASAGGQEAVVRLLLEKGAEVNAQGGHYGSALQAASAEGQEAVVKLLLDKGADVNAQGGHYGNALQAASAEGQEAVVKLLLDKGADVNAQGGHYGNALQAASAEGQEAVVKLLLDKGADMNQVGKYGSALQAASAGGQEAVVKLLFDKGADINQVGKYGSALQAASAEGQEAVVKLLLDKGADMNQVGKYGSALQAASAGGQEIAVSLLHDKGAFI
jgi:ankyrin repeat protein